MTNRMIATPVGFVAISFLLAACAGGQQMMQPMPLAAWQDVTATQLLIADTNPPTPSPPPPIEANAALAVEPKLREALGYYLDPNTQIPITLGQLIAAIQTSNRPGLQGIGGVPGIIFLDAAEKTVKAGNYDLQKKVLVSLSGQILKYEFKQTGTTDRGSGKIVAVTYITRFVTTIGHGPVQTVREAFKWEVEVVDNGVDKGFEIVGIGPNPTTDPFPNTLPYTPDMISLINSRNYTHKLWAKGKGIDIKNVWYKPNINAPWGNPVSHSDPKYGKLYEPLDGNCIDMLFKTTPPPDLSRLTEPPFYCLGRCDRPLLVNTGY